MSSCLMRGDIRDLANEACLPNPINYSKEQLGNLKTANFVVLRRYRKITLKTNGLR